MRILPRLKLSVRGLMLVIAGFAMGIGADRFYNRFDRLMTMATRCGEQAEAERREAEATERTLIRWQAESAKGEYVDSMRKSIEANKSSAEYLERLRSIYKRAAFLPFLPDPAEDDPDGTAY